MSRPIRTRLEWLERRAGPDVQLDLSGLNKAQRERLRVVCEDLIAERITQVEAEAQIPAILAAGTEWGASLAQTNRMSPDC